MNQKTLFKLEYDKIIALLEKEATSFRGGQLCRRLKPMTDINKINTFQEQTAAAFTRIVQKGRISFGDAAPVEESMKRLEVGGALSISELLRISRLLGNAARVKASGTLHFYELDEQGEITAEHLFTPETEIPFVEPQSWHRIAAASDNLECYLSFYCKPEDYMAKKYDTKAHSEVLEAVQSGHIKPGRTLDLGCGHGRNALYLASLGHEVTAVDINNEATQRIQMIADEESYNVRAGYYDINVSALPEPETFDFILSTVVFMFLGINNPSWISRTAVL